MTAPDAHNNDLLRPREVAEILGVRTTTLASWAREGKMTPLLTPGGHRRYHRSDVIALAAALRNIRERRLILAGHDLTDDAVRLYDQGWSIRQVAARFDLDYGAMRTFLLHHTVLRHRGGTHPAPRPDDDEDTATGNMGRYLRQGYSLAQAERLAQWDDDPDSPRHLK